MTALAPIGTVREIDRQSDFIRNFLKYDVIINVTEHNIFVQPPSALPEKITDPLHVPDNTCQIIHIPTMTFRTFMQVSLINMLTFIAMVFGILNVK